MLVAFDIVLSGYILRFMAETNDKEYQQFVISIQNPCQRTCCRNNNVQTVHHAENNSESNTDYKPENKPYHITSTTISNIEDDIDEFDRDHDDKTFNTDDYVYHPVKTTSFESLLTESTYTHELNYNLYQQHQGHELLIFMKFIYQRHLFGCLGIFLCQFGTFIAVLLVLINYWNSL